MGSETKFLEYEINIFGIKLNRKQAFMDLDESQKAYGNFIFLVNDKLVEFWEYENWILTIKDIKLTIC